LFVESNKTLKGLNIIDMNIFKNYKEDRSMLYNTNIDSSLHKNKSNKNIFTTKFIKENLKENIGRTLPLSNAT